MKNFQLYSILLLACLVTGISCGEKTDMENVPLKQAPATVSVFDKLKNATEEGVVDIFDMPEMLTLSKLDSASMKDMAFVLGKNYSVMEEEAKLIGAEIDVPGVINYNNDPENFKLECLLLIKNLPAKQPVKCKIVALEATKMLVYNYYGSYENLIGAYDKIRAYFKEHKIVQSGPMREFYITDPTKETNPAKWLTRIMVPVN